MAAGSPWLTCSKGTTRHPAEAAAPDKGKVQDMNVPPSPPREFRGVWIATVANIDWPSERGLPAEQQRAELIALLDRAARLNLNAIIFQVRPACDALYASEYEPWSEYLTGQMGRAPEPFYDPLAFAVEEAHARGLEPACLVQPLPRAPRVGTIRDLRPITSAKRAPRLSKRTASRSGSIRARRRSQDHSLAVIRDVVRRYDIDGVHLDDYFYPYKEQDEQGNPIEFPDEPSPGSAIRRRGRAGPRRLAARKHRHVCRAALPRRQGGEALGQVRHQPVRNLEAGPPEQIQGFDAYAQARTPTRANGWCGAGWTTSPRRLYWPIEQVAQSYPVLLRWWVEQNAQRHLWPGNFTSRVGGGGRRSGPRTRSSGRSSGRASSRGRPATCTSA